MKMSTLMMEYNQKTKNKFLKTFVKDLLNRIFIKSYIRIYKLSDSCHSQAPSMNLLANSSFMKEKETDESIYMKMPHE